MIIVKQSAGELCKYIIRRKIFLQHKNNLVSFEIYIQKKNTFICLYFCQAPFCIMIFYNTSTLLMIVLTLLYQLLKESLLNNGKIFDLFDHKYKQMRLPHNLRNRIDFFSYLFLLNIKSR
jgi:hypothetical protein